MSIVVVGKSSFIARSILDRIGDCGWMYLSHNDALSDTSWVRDTNCLINFAFSPALKSGPYLPDQDIDLALARIVVNRPIHYIMASSRLVYGHGPEKFRIRETYPTTPATLYGQNKLSTENALLSTLDPDRVTILRLANVFGHELYRSLFFGRMLTSLKETGKIIFDTDPRSRRDFFAVWHLADALSIITQNLYPGIFNLGSGIGTSCADIATWAIEGFGSGTIESTNDGSITDQYWLDTAKAHAIWPSLPEITQNTIRSDCIDCGSWLKNYATH